MKDQKACIYCKILSFKEQLGAFDPSIMTLRKNGRVSDPAPVPFPGYFGELLHPAFAIDLINSI